MDQTHLTNDRWIFWVELKEFQENSDVTNIPEDIFKGFLSVNLKTDLLKSGIYRAFLVTVLSLGYPFCCPANLLQKQQLSRRLQACIIIVCIWTLVMKWLSWTPVKKHNLMSFQSQRDVAPVWNQMKGKSSESVHMHFFKITSLKALVLCSYWKKKKIGLNSKGPVTKNLYQCVWKGEGRRGDCSTGNLKLLQYQKSCSLTQKSFKSSRFANWWGKIFLMWNR